MIRKFALAMALSALAFEAYAQAPQAGNAAAPPQAAPSQPAAQELPKASLIRPDKSMLLIPGRELTVAWAIPNPPTLVTEQAAPPHGLPPIPSDPKLETWGKPISMEHMTRAEAGQIRFSLWVEEGRGTTLIAASGQSQPFFYMASLVMRREGRLVVVPTTICAVRPGVFGIETWPYAVEGVLITGMGLIPADMCYDHTAKKGYKMGEQPPSLADQK